MNDNSPDTTDHRVPLRTVRPRAAPKRNCAPLEALAGGVRAAPDAYRTARGDWLRRERRRRLVLVVLIAVVFTLATLIGLWVLNQTPSGPGVIFSGSGGTVAGTGPG